MSGLCAFAQLLLSHRIIVRLTKTHRKISTIQIQARYSSWRKGPAKEAGAVLFIGGPRGWTTRRPRVGQWKRKYLLNAVISICLYRNSILYEIRQYVIDVKGYGWQRPLDTQVSRSADLRTDVIDPVFSYLYSLLLVELLVNTIRWDEILWNNWPDPKGILYFVQPINIFGVFCSPVDLSRKP